jgi:hypothetical protein
MKLMVPALLLVAGLIIPSIAGIAGADRCGIPIDRTVTFDEHAQNAIVAWNGTEEVLMLTTDLSSQGSGRMLEFLVLPSAPTEITAGNISSFQTMTTLFNKKAEWLNAHNSNDGNAKAAGGSLAAEEPNYEGISILFSTAVGPHNITVVRMISNTHFVDWVRAFAASEGVHNFSVTPELNTSVGGHIARGLEYFVFDMVDLGTAKKTSEPLIYRFNTTYAFYPVDLTYAMLNPSMRNYNQVRLFFVLSGVPKENHFSELALYEGPGFSEYIEFSTSELGTVSPEVASLFEKRAFVSTISGRPYRSYGYRSGTADKDVVVNSVDVYIPTSGELKQQNDAAQFRHDTSAIRGSLYYYIMKDAVMPKEATTPPLLLALVVAGCIAAAAVGAYMLYMIMRTLKSGGAKRNQAIISGAISTAAVALIWFIPSQPIALVSVFGCFPGAIVFGVILLVFGMMKRTAPRPPARKARPPGPPRQSNPNGPPHPPSG